MNVINQLEPTVEQVQSLLERPDDGAFCLVNLFKFRPQAVYDDGRHSELTGAQAYQLYANAVKAVMDDFGARVVFSGDVTHLLLGVVEDMWDQVSVVQYDSRKQMMDMYASPIWQAASVHRNAGLEGQLNIETVRSTLF